MQPNETTSSSQPWLVSNIGYCKPLIFGLKGRAYGREDSISLYPDSISYNSAKSPASSFVIPIVEISKVKQRMQTLWIYTKDGKSYTFEFGSPISQNTGAFTDGVVGLRIMAHGVSDSGINDWYTALASLGLVMDDSAYNTSSGMVWAFIRMSIWMTASLVSLLIVVAVVAAFQNKDGGKPVVFAVEVPILVSSVLLLKYLPTGKRK